MRTIGNNTEGDEAICCERSCTDKHLFHPCPDQVIGRIDDNRLIGIVFEEAHPPGNCGKRVSAAGLDQDPIIDHLIPKLFNLIFHKKLAVCPGHHDYLVRGREEAGSLVCLLEERLIKEIDELLWTSASGEWPETGPAPACKKNRPDTGSPFLYIFKDKG